LRRRRKTEEEEEEEEAKKKIEFHSLCKERGGGAAELRQKQTKRLSPFGRVSGTHTRNPFIR
jgi:ABC-type branched-subunit amino acid transport system ATPase component